jgi:hypothetical protein
VATLLCLAYSRSLRCGHCSRFQQRVCVLCEFKTDVSIPNPAKCEVRSVIRFLNTKGEAPAEIHCQIVSVYGDVRGRDSAVSIATRYGLDGPGSNPCGGEIFCSRLDWPWGPPSLLYNGYWVSFPGVKQLGRGVDHPPPSSAEVKEKSRAIPLLPLWAFMACSRENFMVML